MIQHRLYINIDSFIISSMEQLFVLNSLLYYIKCTIEIRLNLTTLYCFNLIILIGKEVKDVCVKCVGRV